MDTNVITEFLAANQQNLPQYLVILLVIVPLVVWAAVSLWVWKDISNRTHNYLARVTSFLLVVIANFPGLIIYLLIRPEHTIEEQRNLQLFHASILDKDVTACAECGALVRSDYNFCPECSSKLVKTCPNCNERINPFWSFCVNCGEELAKPSWWDLTKDFLRDYLNTVQKVGRYIFNIPSYILKYIQKGWRGYVDLVDKTITTRNKQSTASG